VSFHNVMFLGLDLNCSQWARSKIRSAFCRVFCWARNR